MADVADFETAGKAWDQVAAGITGADEELRLLRPRFITAMTSDKPIAEFEDEVIDTLAVVDWHWPWFDEWDERFDEWRMFPQTWPKQVPGPDEIMQYSPADLEEYRRAAIAPLVVHAASQIFFRDRHLSKAHLHQAWRLAYQGDPAEMRAASTSEAAVKAGDLSKLPPYFPGDRTRLVPSNPLKADDDKRPA